MNPDSLWLIGLHLPSELLPDWLIWIANILFFLALSVAASLAPWAKLATEQELQHVFLGAIVVLLTIWGIRAGISPGLGFHHLGATLFTLMFGWPLAIVGLSLTLLVSLALHTPDWTSLGANGLLSIVLPVSVSSVILKLSQQKLPDNFFIFIFVGAFFGAGVAVAVSRLSAIGLLALTDAYPADQLIEESLQYLPMFMFPEAFVTGMLISIFVVYRPTWVATFNDERYLKGK